MKRNTEEEERENEAKVKSPIQVLELAVTTRGSEGCRKSFLVVLPQNVDSTYCWVVGICSISMGSLHLFDFSGLTVYCLNKKTYHRDHPSEHNNLQSHMLKGK